MAKKSVKEEKKMNPVGWFEIPVADLKRAKKFYEGAFGYKLQLETMGPLKMAWFPMHRGAPCAAGSLVHAPGCYTPSLHGTLVYFGVEDIEATLKKIKKCGGKELMPRTPIGEHGFIAHFGDCEGNRVAIHAMK